MILSDREIAVEAVHGMIDPFCYEQVKWRTSVDKVISYGLSSFGYDIRLASEFKVFTNLHTVIVDPKNFDEKAFVSVEREHVLIPPNSFVLGRSFEHIIMPPDVIAICIGKSTYARCGIVVNVTPLEPGWAGYITIEISNTTPLPAKVYAGEGIAQLLFFRGSQPQVTYASRGGKYQDQKGITLAKV